MKVRVRKVNKNHKLHEFLAEFTASDEEVLDLTIYEDEYKSSWSMYISMRQAVNRYNVSANVHFIGNQIYIEKF